jgi:hypothetical protein
LGTCDKKFDEKNDSTIQLHRSRGQRQSGVLSQRFLFWLLALAFLLLVFEVHTDTELDRVEEGLTARKSEQ